MSETMMHPSIDTPIGPPRRGLVRNRLHNFGLTMVVMGASFILYYLGLFGTVDGPLNPNHMGTVLAELGVTRRHVILMLLSVLIGAISWNWIFNLTSLVIGNRLTCKAASTGGEGICAEPVKRRRYISRRTGRTMVDYVCSCGHRRSEAHFHPIKKGAVSNTVWVACAAFVLIAMFCT